MTGKVANLSNYPQGFQGGVALDGLATHRTHTGKVLYVGGGSAGTHAGLPNTKSPANGNNGTLLAPLKNLSYAVEQTVSGRGDVIVLLPGLVDSLDVAVDIEGNNVTILGLGAGDSRPQLTPAVVDCLDVEGDNVTIQNVLFNESAAERTAGAAAIDVVGNGFRFIGNRVDLGAHDDVFITVAASRDLSVVDNKFVVTADGTESVVDLEGIVDAAQFSGNVVVNSESVLDEGFVDMEAIACTNTYFKDNVMLGGGSLLVSTADVGTVVDSVAGQYMKCYLATEILSGDTTVLGSVESGSIAIWGIMGITSASNGSTIKWDVSTEAAGPQGSLVLMLGEDETLDAAGDILTCPTPGAAHAHIEIAGDTPQPIWSSPVIVAGDTEIDAVSEGATEGATDWLIWYTPVTEGASIGAAE